jgi:hypothetical protein
MPRSSSVDKLMEPVSRVYPRDQEELTRLTRPKTKKLCTGAKSGSLDTAAGRARPFVAAVFGAA